MIASKPVLLTASDGALAWRFLEEGFAPRERQAQAPSWDGTPAFVSALDGMEGERRERLLKELRVDDLDRVLAPFGGDPLYEDWHGFRPLAIQREEGWSDWLAHLVATGDQAFVEALLPGLVVPGSRPIVQREEVLLLDSLDIPKGHYRSDIIITWAGASLAVHVEVKVGDAQLDKTWAEAAHLRRTHGGEWKHYLLVLREDAASAHARKEIIEASVGVPTICILTWHDVEHALREALLREATAATWRALARAFTGALGQLKLSRPVLQRQRSDTNGD